MTGHGPTRTSEPLTQRSITFPDGLWNGLGMLARMKRTSVSAELREAAEALLGRYGLAVVDGDVVLGGEWLVESKKEEESTGEEKIHGEGPATPHPPPRSTQEETR